MKKAILVTVKGRQTFSEVTDSVELTTNGTLDELDDKYIVEYTQQQEKGQPESFVQIEIAKDGTYARIDKSGDFHSTIMVKNASRTQCEYATEFGIMQMGIFGKKIESLVLDGEGVFTLWYVIDIRGEYSSRNRVKISYKEIG